MTTDTPTTDREARLPKWARDELAKVRRDVEAARAEAATARAENPPHEHQSAWLDAYPDDPFPLPVRRRQAVIFTEPGQSPEDRFDQSMIEVRSIEDGWFEITGVLGALHVRPWVSNVIRVKVIHE